MTLVGTGTFILLVPFLQKRFKIIFYEYIVIKVNILILCIIFFDLKVHLISLIKIKHFLKPLAVLWALSTVPHVSAREVRLLLSSCI